MISASEIYQGNFKKGYIGKELSQKASIANLQIIMDTLEEKEEVLMCFNGFLNQKSITKSEGLFTYLVTNKRLLMGRKQAFGKEVRTLLWDNVESFSYKEHNPYTNIGRITIETLAKPYDISMMIEPAGKVFQELNGLLEGLKRREPEVSVSSVSVADEILKFKNLLDVGAITQEEFELKKKQLLVL